MAKQIEVKEIFELVVIPNPPDNVMTVKEELLPYIKKTLKEKNLDPLLSKGEIQFDVEKTFPTDEVVIIVVTLLSGMALETFKEIILPELKRRFKVWQKSRR